MTKLDPVSDEITKQVLSIIWQSFRRAVQNSRNKFRKDSVGAMHRARSANLLSILQVGLEKYYQSLCIEHKIVVFCGSGPRNQDFRRNEFLYDIHVCEYDFVPSGVKGTAIPFVKKSFLQLESEFANNTRESLIDFSKLVCGLSDLKIMLLPRSPNREHYLAPLRMAALELEGPIYAVFLPHPRNWGESQALGGMPQDWVERLR
jgi:hypothetical protein